MCIRDSKRIVRFARVVARCGVVVNEDSSVNFNRGTAGFPVGILNVDDRIPTVDGIALRFEYTAINLQVSFLRGACRCYQNTRAVSYTHLDVYKRQRQVRAFALRYAADDR